LEDLVLLNKLQNKPGFRKKANQNSKYGIVIFEQNCSANNIKKDLQLKTLGIQVGQAVYRQELEGSNRKTNTYFLRNVL
jgi:hypothetical protein